MNHTKIRYLVKMGILVLGLSILAGCSSGSKSSGGSAESVYATAGKSYPVFEQKTLAEINKARTNPSGYATERLQSEYTAKTDNGAYEDLQKRTPVGALTLQTQICKAAAGYAAFMAQNNVFDHNLNGTTPGSRCQAAGYSFWSGENIAANGWDYCNAESDPEGAAINFVKQLIIDQGVASLGHRNNIMNSGHKVLGVGFARDTNSTYKNYTVQDFGSK